MPVAIVTGASRGLGAAMAKALGRDGHAVAVNDAHDDNGAARVVAAIREAGGTAEAFRFDVTNETEVKRGVAAITTALGSAEVVVNNAIGPHDGRPIEDETWDYYLAQLNFCVKAPLQLLQAVLGGWKAKRAGCVINIGSEVVDIGNANASHYIAAKSAMIGMTRSWARELGPFNIRVNLVAPGFIPVERHENESRATLEEYTQHVPFGRMGVPEDIAAMVAFLASPRAAFITGQTFAVNGGRTFA